MTTILIIIAVCLGFLSGAMWKSSQFDDDRFEPRETDPNEDSLEEQLNSAVEDEDYEKAAKLRDKIKKANKKMLTNKEK